VSQSLPPIAPYRDHALSVLPPVGVVGLDKTPPGEVSQGWVRKSRAHLQDNHMVRNSLFSLLSSALQAGLGFAFWVLAARLFSTSEVGRATSLISATTLIGFVALFGLNSTLARYMPTTRHRDTMITVGIIFVAACGTLVALGYVVALPFVAPNLRFVDARISFAIGFAVLTGAAAVNIVTDAVFIASRRSGMNALVDGGIGGVVKLVMLPLLAGTGAFGLFCASAGGFAAAGAASILLIWTQLHYRPRFKGALAVMLPLLRFSMANYMGNVFNLAPTLVVTLIVLDRLGPASAAYYYMAFQFANLLFSGAYAVEQNFLAEGAHGEEGLKSLMWRAGRLLAMLAVPSAIVGALLAHWILLVFGRSYAVHGTDALVLLALAAIPIAAQQWLVTVLRLTGQLLAISVCNGVYAVAICGFAWFWTPHGLAFVGLAWLAGASAGFVAAAVAVLMGSRRGALAI
jgi:O-antigen/teichoic acid export membrane protein